jgi:hypothetical protein
MESWNAGSGSLGLNQCEITTRPENSSGLVVYKIDL